MNKQNKSNFDIIPENSYSEKYSEKLFDNNKNKNNNEGIFKIKKSKSDNDKTIKNKNEKNEIFNQNGIINDNIYLFNEEDLKNKKQKDEMANSNSNNKFDLLPYKEISENNSKFILDNSNINLNKGNTIEINDNNYKENNINNDLNDNNINNIIIKPSKNKNIIQSSLISENEDKNIKIMNIEKINKTIEITEIIKKYLRYIIKDKIKRIIKFKYTKNDININNISKEKNFMINLESYLKILKMLSGKEKEKKDELITKEILIDKYKQYIILLKKNFENLQNEDKSELNLNNFDKKEFGSLIKKLIGKIILIKKIYIYLIIIINNDKIYNKKEIIKKEEKNINDLKKEIEEIKKKIIIILKRIKNKEEIKKYLKLIIIELNKIILINEKDIEHYDELYLKNNEKKNNILRTNKKIIGNQNLRNRFNLWILIIPLFYIIYFFYVNDKSNEN